MVPACLAFGNKVIIVPKLTNGEMYSTLTFKAGVGLSLEPEEDDFVSHHK